MPTYGAADYVDAPTKEASALMRKYVLADNQEQKQALEQMAALAKKNKSNENVIRIGVNNLDYLMILYFSGDKRFDQAKEKYLRHNGNDAIISIFDKSRDEVLQQLYPK